MKYFCLYIKLIKCKSNMSKNMTSGDGLNSGGFEMERMLRWNAHEKAFEI